MRRLSLKIRLILVLSLVLTVAFLAVSLINYRLTSEAVHSELVDSALPLTRDTIYSEIQADLVRPIYVSSLMANDTFLKEWAEEGEQDLTKITAYLSEIKNRYHFFTAFFVSARSNTYYYHGGVLKTISPQDAHDVWYYDFVNSGERYDIDVDTNQAADDILTVFINHRIVSADGELLGVTGVGLEMSLVSELIGEYQQRYDRRILLLDEHGTLQVHPDQTLIGHASIRDLPGLGEIADEVLATGTVPRDFTIEAAGHTYLVTVRYLPEFKWQLVVVQDETMALQVVRDNFTRSMGVGLAAIVFVLAVVIFTVNYFQSQLERQASTDELTGVANRREFERAFLRATSRFSRHGTPVSVMILDIDSFKNINDRYGHVVGDAVLVAVSETIGRLIRQSDTLARWGGDEFAVLVEGDETETAAAAERIVHILSEMRVPAPNRNGILVQVTMSCGVGSYRQGDDLDMVLARADDAMYQAKRSGNGQTCAVAAAATTNTPQ